MFTIEQLDKVIKAYDVRGLVSKEITPDFSFVLATAFARLLSFLCLFLSHLPPSSDLQQMMADEEEGHENQSSSQD